MFKSRPKLGQASLFGVFLTVFLDMLSFGIFIPDLQLRGAQVAAAKIGVSPESTDSRLGLLVGFSLAVFSLTQLLAAPWIGRMSDRHGRKLVLLITAALNLLGYLCYAHAQSYEMMLAARVLGGLGAANLGVAFAYVADITTPENRAKGLGMMGAAFGLGFILGPALGTVLLKIGNDSPLTLGYAGAFLILINIIYIQFGLVESYKPEDRDAHAPSLIENFKVAIQTPNLRILLLMFFVLSLGFTNLETTYFQLLADKRTVFGLSDPKTAGGVVLVLVGFVAVLMQGFLVPKLTPRYGEVKLARFGLLCTAPALALVPYAPLWLFALPVIALLGIGNGAAQPSISSLVSRSSPKSMQGGIFGITNALGALARCIGPMISAPLFRIEPSGPYWLGAGLILIPAVAAWWLKQPADSEAGAEVFAH